MRRTIGLLSAVLLGVAAMSAALPGLAATPAPAAKAIAPLPLVPWPQQLELQSGEFALTPRTPLRGEAQSTSASALRSALKLESGGKGPGIALRIDPRAVTANEGYELQVKPAGIAITGHDQAGLFYGAQTLLQLLPTTCGDDCRVPALHISDAPRYAWRGLLIDIARHFFDERALMSVMDQMAAHKLNRLHLHLTDDTGWRFDVPGYPALASIGAVGDADSPGQGAVKRLDPAAIHRLVYHAAARHIEIVPEVEMPAHIGAAARALPELFDQTGTLVPGLPGTAPFVHSVFAAAANQFPSGVMHFGGDEVSAGSWSGDASVQALMQREKLGTRRAVEGWFDNSVARTIIDLGRRPMAWDEAAEAGVDPRVIIQWWRKDRPDVLMAAIDSGHDVVLSPVDRVYFDYHAGQGEPGAPWEGNDGGPVSVEKILAWDPTPPDFTAAQRAHVLGVEAALWTEFIRSERYLQFMLYPRLFALAEVAWSDRARPGAEDFARRIGPHLDRLAASGIRFRRNFDDAVEFMTH